jgi:hypothetical protein
VGKAYKANMIKKLKKHRVLPTELKHMVEDIPVELKHPH